MVKIYHKDWTDNIILNSSENTMNRISENKDTGKYILNDNFLIILWDSWGKECFYSKNNLDYYQITDNNYFKLDISFIYIITYDYSDLYILDNNSKKIYNKNTLKLFDNKFIFYNNKYYEKTYFDEFYKIIFLDNVEHILSKDSYENMNKITINNIEYTQDSNNNYYYYSSYILLEDNKLNSNKYDELLINDKTKFFINDKVDNNSYITNIIKYYESFNYNYILFNNINLYNQKYNNLNVIYYHDLEDVAIFIDKYNIQNLYINIYKVHRKLYLQKYNLIQYNEKILDVKSIWFEINNHHITKFSYLLNNSSIPKIMHFIWLGTNKLPDIYLEYIKSWISNHNDWTFCFWNDDNIPCLINQKIYNETDVPAMKADILRYELLYIFGGVYIDCDFLCLKNIDDIISSYDGFSGYESNEYIAIGLMGFIPYDNMLLNIIKELTYNFIINKNKSLPIPELTGPIFFTKMWNKYKTDKHYAFPINYFYSYTFQDKIDNKMYIIGDDNYAIHMWGHSWKDNNNASDDITCEYYLLNMYLSNIINNYEYDNIKIKYKYCDLSMHLRNKIYFTPSKSGKKNIVNIMGVFFTGGIERYLYYIDKYGNHELYNYYLLYISNDNDKYVYDIKNMTMISFDWNHYDLNKLLIMISPDLIIDHYSIYINDNTEIYKNINKNNIIYFIHSALCYNNDISNLDMRKCINLYNEINKHDSWNNIKDNYYLTLGTELVTLQEKILDKNNIKISIIGRITEEKIPISFFIKLCNVSNDIFDKIEIHIYGEKDIQFNKTYVDDFEKYILESKIILHDFTDTCQIYNTTDVLLIPSTYETGSFTCIEAFSYGIPVIARNVYGLKYLIKHSQTGYLCDTDEDIINKIININEDEILNNKDYIKYNIVDKIKDFEEIILKNTNNQNLVIITSVLNTVNKPLSYYHQRSIFTVHERYKHTLKSIQSIRKYIPDVEILFCECSDMTDMPLYEKDIRAKVDYYYNFNNIRSKVESPLKGLGEAYILINGFEKIHKSYKNIFKLSGRYYLNSNFNYEMFNNNKNIFTNWDNSINAYCTVFYKINGEDILLLKNALINSIPELECNQSIELALCKYFNPIENINVLEKLNVSGFLATEGYLFTV